MEIIHPSSAYLIYHRHEADGPGAEEGAGKDWFLDANGIADVVSVRKEMARWVNNQTPSGESN